MAGLEARSQQKPYFSSRSVSGSQGKMMQKEGRDLSDFSWAPLNDKRLKGSGDRTWQAGPGRGDCGEHVGGTSRWKPESD